MLRLAIRVPAEHADTVLADLIAIAPSGLEQVDGEGFTEYAIYGAPGELPSLPDLETVIGGVKVEVSTSEVEDGWEERWREFHRPLVIDRRLRVRPPWEPAGTEAQDIVIDPGRAFGTGAHPTTSLCLELLLDERPSGSLLDLGCGSGVLAILAARLGYAPVAAADYDVLAVEAAAANAAVNGVAIDVAKLDLRSDPIPAAETLVANILSPVLLELADRLIEPGAFQPERAILSGLLDEQCDSVSRRWEDLGFSEVDRASRDGWTALLMGRR